MRLPFPRPSRVLAFAALAVAQAAFVQGAKVE
jgi:hypothetical protein